MLGRRLGELFVFIGYTIVPESVVAKQAAEDRESN